MIHWFSLLHAFHLVGHGSLHQSVWDFEAGVLFVTTHTELMAIRSFAKQSAAAGNWDVNWSVVRSLGYGLPTMG